MSVAFQSEEVIVRHPRRMRAALAISVLAVLAIQCITGVVSPKMASASARPVEPNEGYQLQAPARGEMHKPSRYVRGYRYPTGKDPRHC